MKIKPFKQFFYFYRVNEWIYLLGLTLMGYFAFLEKTLTFYDVSQAIIISASYLAYGYSFNLLFDSKNSQPSTPQMLMSYLPAGFALVLSLFHSFDLLLLIFCGIILNYMYSAPAISLKGKPPLDILVNSSLFTVVFLIGAFISSGQIISNHVPLSLMVFFCVIPFQLVHELNHKVDDFSNELKTTVIAYGTFRIIAIIRLSALGAAFTCVISGSNLIYIAFSILFFIYLMVDSERSFKTKMDLRSRMRVVGLIYGIFSVLLFSFL